MEGRANARPSAVQKTIGNNTTRIQNEEAHLLCYNNENGFALFYFRVVIGL